MIKEKLFEDKRLLEKDLDLEDVFWCLCAKENDYDILITNDTKFYDCSLKILNIDEFSEKYL
jgi:predicted nucleic acid-binding protein